MSEIATAMRRAVSVLERRPATGLHDDAPGSVRWIGGLRTEARHPDGHVVLTDLTPELGGEGGQVSPGWMLRSGVAACTATAIVAIAAERGIKLAGVEVRVDSRSDVRGYLGMTEADGASIDPGPVAMAMHVKVRAHGVPEAAIRDLVSAAQRRAPMTSAVEKAHDMATTIEVEAA
jgi:uncharacterized OsmC-like protein